MATNLSTGTPSITVSDNRGLIVRALAYNRTSTEDSLDERITRSTFTPFGYAESTIDPRLYTAMLSDPSLQPNVFNQYDLIGRTMKTTSVDSGWSAALSDAEGQMAWSADARKTETEFDYDALGRTTAIRERADGESESRVRERYVYGETEDSPEANNLRGQLVKHYDASGLSASDSFSLTGAPFRQTRQLLNDLDTASDWQDEQNRDGQLAADSYVTSWTYDAVGKTLTQTDAKGNIQRYVYDMAGQLKSSSLTLQGGSEQIVLNEITYNAAGLRLSETAGNGTTTEYDYEPETLRLTGIKTSRPVSGGSLTVLQDLRYEYDPVGNVLEIHNDAEETRFFRNQKVIPRNQYTYDALYQLISASGRESDANRQYQSFPPNVTPIPADPNQYVNYTQTFTYDRGGNLVKIQHNGASQYTTEVSVSATSNRAVWQSDGSVVTDVESYFDAHGNLKNLQPGINLVWNALNQLQSVSPVVREGDADDNERYFYDGGGMRIVKQTAQKTGGSLQSQRVIYLPGLEIRTRSNGDAVTETFNVVTMNTGGRAQVRILHWENGKPDGIDNDQFRYRFSDQQESCLLELDSEAQIISQEEYYSYGGTAIWATRSQVEADYKFVRYSGKELDATGLYYYGFRYYMSWIGRWLNPDPLGAMVELNLYRFVGNNPVSSQDVDGLIEDKYLSEEFRSLISGSIDTKYGYGSDLATLHSWGSRDPDPTQDTRINPFSPRLGEATEPTHQRLIGMSQSEQLLKDLGAEDRQAIFHYSQESMPYHAMFLWGLSEEQRAKGYTEQQAYSLRDALLKIPAYEGQTFRGALLEGTVYKPEIGDSSQMRYIPKQYTDSRSKERKDFNVINVGDYVATKTFFSTSAEVKAASEFVLRQRFGNAFAFNTALFRIQNSSGRNITELTQEHQAEVLLSPGAIFKVTSVNYRQYGVEIGLEEQPDSTWDEPGIVVRDYRFGYTFQGRPAYPTIRRSSASE